MKKTITTEEYDGAGVLKKRIVTVEEDNVTEYPWHTNSSAYTLLPQVTYTPEIRTSGFMTLGTHTSLA